MMDLSVKVTNSKNTQRIKKMPRTHPKKGYVRGSYFSYGSALSAILMISSSAIVCRLYSRT